MWRVWLVIAVLLIAVAAEALDIPVTYTVDSAEFERRVTGTTQLTFALYSDSQCTAAVHTEVANADGLTFVERLNLVQVPGAPPPVGVARITHVLTDVSPQPAFFLKVSGVGILPRAGGCQFQHALLSFTCLRQEGGDLHVDCTLITNDMYANTVTGEELIARQDLVTDRVIGKPSRRDLDGHPPDRVEFPSGVIVDGALSVAGITTTKVLTITGP